MLLQICLISVFTLITVVIMYLHSNSAFDSPVPRCLLAFTCLSGRSRRVRDGGGQKELYSASYMKPFYDQEEVELEALVDLLQMVRKIHKLLDERERRDDQRQLWNRACYRLDVMGLIIGQLANAALMVWWLWLQTIATGQTLEDFFKSW